MRNHCVRFKGQLKLISKCFLNLDNLIEKQYLLIYKTSYFYNEVKCSRELLSLFPLIQEILVKNLYCMKDNKEKHTQINEKL